MEYQETVTVQNSATDLSERCRIPVWQAAPAYFPIADPSSVSWCSSQGTKSPSAVAPRASRLQATMPFDCRLTPVLPPGATFTTTTRVSSPEPQSATLDAASAPERSSPFRPG